MTYDEVGYKRPPKSHRFRPGVSGNPNGRPKRKPLVFAATIEKVLDGKIKYREGGRQKVASARELSLKTLVACALKGQVAAAEQVLKILERAERAGDARAAPIEITDWLPDFAGQTGAQKAQQLVDGENGRAESDPAARAHET